MAVTITSSLRIGLVSGTGVNFNAPVVPQFTTDDIFVADNPSQNLSDFLGGLSSEQLVATVSVDGTSIHNYPMYTVPAGTVFVVTKLVMFLTDVSGSGNPPVVSLGWTSPDFNELIDDVKNASYSLRSAGNTIFAGGTVYSANDVLTLVGGTHTVAATVTVSTVSSGVVTAFTRTAAGTYTVIPANPIAVTGGGGSGFKLNGVWNNGSVVLTMAESNEVEVVTDFGSLSGTAGANYTTVPGGSVITLRVPFVTSFTDYTFKALLFGFSAS